MGRQAERGSRPGLRSAFTLIEVLVTIVLVAVALTGVMGGIRALGAADVKARDADRLQRLAAQKMSELGSITDPRTTDASGDFSEQGFSDISWTIDVQPSGAENVDLVTVTVTRGGDAQALTGLVYVRPVAAAGDAGT